MIYPSRGSRRLFCAYSYGMCVCGGGRYRVNNARCVGVVTRRHNYDFSSTLAFSFLCRRWPGRMADCVQEYSPILLVRESCVHVTTICCLLVLSLSLIHVHAVCRGVWKQDHELLLAKIVLDCCSIWNHGTHGDLAVQSLQL